MTREPSTDRNAEALALDAALAGDHAAFSALSERYRHQLRVHCYRMLGSFDAADDMVQETFLRAWRGRASFEGRSLLRTWLYRIATNVCLNALERSPTRVLPPDVAAPISSATPGTEARSAPAWAPEVPWLEPYPDALLELAAAEDCDPHSRLAARQSIELAFLAALQHLPARQRAILLLAEVLGWASSEIADALEVSVASVTSGIQRARATLRARGLDASGARREPSTDDERAALKTFMAAWEQGDTAELTRLLREDARWSMPPAPLWFAGRAAIESLLRLYPPRWQGREFKLVALGANRQPAAAAYLRMPGEVEYRLTGLHVLRVEAGEIAEITTFSGKLYESFRLPFSL